MARSSALVSRLHSLERITFSVASLAGRDNLAYFMERSQLLAIKTHDGVTRRPPYSTAGIFQLACHPPRLLDQLNRDAARHRAVAELSPFALRAYLQNAGAGIAHRQPSGGCTYAVEWQPRQTASGASETAADAHSVPRAIPPLATKLRLEQINGLHPSLLASHKGAALPTR